MLKWHTGVVTAHGRQWDGCAEVTVRIEPDFSSAEKVDGAAEARALAYLPMVGLPNVGERVVLSANAVARGLGTGGYMFVVARPDAIIDEPATTGHIMKARYTPLQWMTLAAEEQDSPHHDLLAEADSIAQMPVVVADLHSALPAIIAGIRTVSPTARVVYILDDGAALPAWFSRAVDGLRQAGWLEAVISAGQAYGGDYECVNIYTALLTARLVTHADIAIIAQGPGNVGTGTRWGFSGVSVGDNLNAASILHGQPIAALRLSGSDARARHSGISHHSTTVLTRIVAHPTVVPVPVGSDSSRADGANVTIPELDTSALAANPDLTLVPVPIDGLGAALESCPVGLSSMGRSFGVDPLPFYGVAVAGVVAAHKM